MTQLKRTIIYMGLSRVLACDGRCEKAWGLNARPCAQLDHEDKDDFAWLADGELGDAPEDPGSYEGDHAKPSPAQKLESKWCARQCERSTMVEFGEDIVLRDLSQRFYNKPPHTREDPKAMEHETPGVPLTKEVMDIASDLVLQLADLSIKERLTVLVTMIRLCVNPLPDPVREWGRILSSLLEGNDAQVELLASNLVAQVARKHGVMPALERTVDVVSGLEAQILAGLERAARVAD